MQNQMTCLKFTVIVLLALAFGLPAALAAPVLGTELASFAVLGASTVTSTGATTLTGSLGVSPGTAITGFGPGAYTGTLHSNDPVARTAHAQLATAMTNLQKMGSGTSIAGNLDGLILAPGVYTVAAATTNLTQTLTLDGGGNANAFWIFNMPSTLITSTGATVNVINAGAGAGVYWIVGSSATLGTGTTFVGNILATASITMNHGVNINCGRALALNAAVTLITDSVNAVDCSGTGEEGSSGLSGGLDVPPDGSAPTPLPPSGSASCSLLLSVPNHVAETTQALTVTAITSSNTVCPSLVNVSRAFTFSCGYVNPASGTLPLRMGANVALASSTSTACSAGGADLSLNFNASGVANATLIYADAGQMTLSATYTPGGGAAISGTRTFIVAPAKFAFASIKQTAAPASTNPAAANDQGAKFIKAGEAFSATVTAQNQLNNPTANFGREALPEQLSVAASLVAPSGGNMPALTGSFGAFSGGVASATNLAWGVAGILSLTASLSNAHGYLVTSGAPSNLAVSGSSGNVGRFVPDHFDTSITPGVPMPCPSARVCPPAGFVYSRQAFGVTVTARNLAGGTTANYAGLYARAATLGAWSASGSTTLANPPSVPGGSTLTNPGVAAASFVLGSASVASPAYSFLSAYPALVNLAAPTDIYLRAFDTDGVTSLRGAASVEGGVSVVSGRLKVASNYGSELLALPVYVYAQFWDGQRFINSTSDNSSMYNRSNVVMSNCTNNLSTGTACKAVLAVAATPASFTLAYGGSHFNLNPPGAGNTGSVDLSINAFPYLPSTTAKATLGIYKAGPIIYMRELY